MKEFDVCVIGAGPGGYVAAIRAAQLGFKTAIVEREFLGGVCLNVGCVPSKAMITAAHHLHKAQHDFPEMGLEFKGKISVNMEKLVKWKESVSQRMSGGVEQLLKGNKVSILWGEAEFKDQNSITIKAKDGDETLKAKHFILATGSRPIQIPGFELDETHVLSSTGALGLSDVPKRLAVIGGGYIGLEIGSYLAKLGTEVTVIEAAPAVLNGVVDKDCAQVVARKLKKDKVQVMLNAKAKGYAKKGKALEVTVDNNGKDEKLLVDKILLTVGRKPNSDQGRLEKAGIQLDEKGFVKIDAQCRTTNPNIFAIGDVAGQPMLAHKASHEGVMVAEIIGGANRVYDAKTVPAVVFTDPEIASAGMTEEECKTAGYSNLKVAKFPFGANARAVSLMEADGFVKMIANADNNVVLGIHICGPEASNMISEAALAIEMGARLEDIALTIHPHPTLGETMMEAAEAALGHAIHVIQKPLTKSSRAHA